MSLVTQHTIECASHAGKECNCPMGILPAVQDIRVQLATYISTAFKHEEEFLEKFCHNLRGDDLQEMYMGDARSQIMVAVPSGTIITTTISTTKFIAWCNDMNNSLDGVVLA